MSGVDSFRDLLFTGFAGINVRVQHGMLVTHLFKKDQGIEEHQESNESGTGARQKIRILNPKLVRESSRPSVMRSGELSSHEWSVAGQLNTV